MRRKQEREKLQQRTRRQILEAAFVHKGHLITAELLEYLKRLSTGMSHPTLPYVVVIVVQYMLANVVLMRA
jgi:hypothetical protein